MCCGSAHCNMLLLLVLPPTSSPWCITSLTPFNTFAPTGCKWAQRNDTAQRRCGQHYTETTVHRLRAIYCINWWKFLWVSVFWCIYSTFKWFIIFHFFSMLLLLVVFRCVTLVLVQRGCGFEALLPSCCCSCITCVSLLLLYIEDM